MENFEEVVEGHEMVLLDFWAAWCQPCKLLGPVFEEMSNHNSDIFFGKVNTEQSQDLAQAFQVRSIPTIMAFKKGELVFEQSGLLPPAQLEKLLENLRKLELPPPDDLEEEMAGEEA
jgi:thioredoxin